jgi:hypothetical protein
MGTGGKPSPHECSWYVPWGDKNAPNPKFWTWLFAQKRGVLPTSYDDPFMERQQVSDDDPILVIAEETKAHPIQKQTTGLDFAMPTKWEKIVSASTRVAPIKSGDMHHLFLTIASILVLVSSTLLYKRRWKNQTHSSLKMEDIKANIMEDPEREELLRMEDKSDVQEDPELETSGTSTELLERRVMTMTDPSPAPTTTVMLKRRHIHAFGVARFLASLHIVAGHLYRDELRAVPDFWVFEYGYTWVPYFMMMSGFILSYVRLTSREPDKLPSVFEFVQARLFSIYPLYLSGLFIALALQWLTHGPAAFQPKEFALSCFLMQAWIPSYTEHVLQPHCWFLSCIVPYWIAHNSLYRFIKRMSKQQLVHLLLGCWLIPFALLCCLALGQKDWNWYLHHSWGHTDTWIDILVIGLKFHPLCYVHTYVFGMATACWYVKVEEEEGMKQPQLCWRTTICTYGVSIGYGCLLGLFFSFNWINVPSAGLTLRLGLLAPLQSLTMIGMLINKDPLSRLFSYGMLPLLENLSYPQYVFQFLCFQVWGRAYATAGFWLFLAATAFGGYHIIQQPLKNMKMKSGHSSSFLSWRKIGAVFAIVFGAPVVFVLLVDWNSTSSSSSHHPSKVQYLNGEMDVRLFINHISGSSMTMYSSSSNSFYINPSVMMNPKTNRLSVAVRKHRMSIERSDMLPIKVEFMINQHRMINQTSGPVVYERLVWESEIGIGELDPETLEVVQHSMHRLELMPSSYFCRLRPSLSPHNQTMTQMIVDGPQDPRLFWNPKGELWLTFFSLPTTSLDDQSCVSKSGGKVFQAQVSNPNNTVMMLTGIDRREALPQEIQPLQLSSKKHHQPSAIEIMTKKKDQSQKASYPVVSQRYAKDYVALRSEKNWLAFIQNNEQYFVTEMHPFTIVHVVDQDKVRVLRSHFCPYLIRHIQEHPGTVAHGGANPVHLQATSSRPSYYLAVFHTINPSHAYMNYAFEFMDQYPYSILRISKPLPLVLVDAQDASISKPLGFVSGLTQLKPNGKFVFSYGSSNAESRALTMSPDTLEDLFRT